MLTAIIVAAGSSRRIGFDKLFEAIAGKPVIAHTIDAFELADSVAEIIVVTRKDRCDEIRKISRDQSFKKVQAIITGGEYRQDSVRAGLENLSRDARYVAIHDAARPLVTPEQIERVFEQCQMHDAAALAEPVRDTLKHAGVDLVVTGSVDRHQLYAMQTPQIFKRGLIEEAYRAIGEGVLATDEVSAVEQLGRKVFLVPNDDLNFKITYPRDLPLAEFVLNQRTQRGPD
jgi:2-C-methyl-D-erythritol 4-phosphate cytidylyltransferase